MIKEFNKNKLDKPAPLLANATDLQKNALDTNAFKGKVVVLDFWVTWCGPCNMAFPYMQKVYEKYKDNPRVAFLIMDSGWENTLKQALKWQKKNDYTFPLYFDQGSKITSSYGVRGIPTTFVIGPKGNIQFKDIGYEGPSMKPKLALKIDMLLHSTDNDVMSSADSK